MTTSRHTLLTVTALSIALGMPASGAALAQTGGVGQQQQQQQTFPEQNLRAYARAAIEVSELQQQFRGQLQQAQGAEEQQAIQEEANAAMIAAIEGEGLSLEQYNQIATAMQSNPDLVEDIRGYLEEEMEQ